MRSDLNVQIGYLDHGPPLLADVDTSDAVVVPMFLARGFHVLSDVPAQTTQAVIARAIGPDPLLAVAVRDRLAEAGYDGKTPVVLAAAGSKSPQALNDVATAAEQLSELIGARVEPAYVAEGKPLLAKIDLSKMVVATYLLSPGAFADDVAACGAALVSAPIGAHPAVAQIVLDRYDLVTADQVPGRIAPA